MYKQMTLWALAAATLPFLMACSAMDVVRVGKNLTEEDSHLLIKLDGQEAKQNKLKKGATGYSEFKVKEAVGTGPTLRFDIEKPEKFGRITMVAVSIFQKFEADYSNQAEFTIVSNVQDSQAQMKPNTDYSLAAPGPGFKVLDLNGKSVSGVTLKPGMKYMLTLTVKADKSETAQVYFETK